MRPLARKILLTQGVIILMVLGVSIFSWLQMLDARERAAQLRAEYELGGYHEKLVAELRDIVRSHSFYLLEKRDAGNKVPSMQTAFYHSLEELARGIDELAKQSATREDLAGLVQDLRGNLDQYREMTGRLEYGFLVDDSLGDDYASNRVLTIRKRMQDMTEDGLEDRDEAMTELIDDLGRRAQVGAGLAVAFFALALTVGLAAAYGLTRSIHRPVLALREATEALSRGEFDRRIQVANRDELGDLARAFNEMAARLQELDELKSGFVSMVSHDLKTPLTSMKEAVDMLSEGVGGDLTARQSRLLTIASESLDRLGRYVQGILDVFRFEAGRIHLVLEPLSLTEVVKEQIDLAEVRCRDAGLNLRTELDRDLPPLEGDRFRLAQIVANLLDNAIKFTPRGGQVIVRTGVQPWKDDLGLILEVSDSGAGIAPRDLRHIFDKFFQAPSSSRPKVGGAGLGLAIVRNLVEAHHGKVTVESVLGRGTTFKVQFPSARRQAVDQALAG
jgi:signal transduction histidine kinase